MKYTLRTATLSYARGNSRYASTAWVNDGLGAVTATSIDATRTARADAATRRVEYTGPLSFTPEP